MRSRKTDDTSEERLGLADIVRLGVALGVGLTDPEGDAEADGDGVGEGLALGEGDGLLLALDDGDTESDGDRLLRSPSSISACPQERLSTSFRTSRFDPNLNEPGIPRFS